MSVTMLVAISILFHLIESMIPIPVPIPGFKLGLANIVGLIALYLYDEKIMLSVNLMRVLLASLLVNPEHGNSGEQNEKDIAFRYRRRLGSNGIYFYDNFTTFIPAFLNLSLSDEEARAWTEALSPSEKAFLIETINASDNSDGLKKDMIAIVENPTLLTEEEGIREELSRRENDEAYKHEYGLALSALPGNNGRMDVEYTGNWYQLRESDYRKIVDSRGRVILPELEFLALMEKLAEEYGYPVDLGR